MQMKKFQYLSCLLMSECSSARARWGFAGGSNYNNERHTPGHYLIHGIDEGVHIAHYVSMFVHSQPGSLGKRGNLMFADELRMEY
jgi:hypothetical protein